MCAKICKQIPVYSRSRIDCFVGWVVGWWYRTASRYLVELCSQCSTVETNFLLVNSAWVEKNSWIEWPAMNGALQAVVVVLHLAICWEGSRCLWSAELLSLIEKCVAGVLVMIVNGSCLLRLWFWMGVVSTCKQINKVSACKGRCFVMLGGKK